MERIKLIWDFRSADAEKIAEHHVKHLLEYISAKNISNSTASHEKVNDAYWTAHIETTRNYLIQLRDDLKPHRGEII